MPKQLSGFSCDLCNDQFSDMDKATECEKSHNAEGAAQIVHRTYQPSRGGKGPQADLLKVTPVVVEIDFGSHVGQYKLVGFSPKDDTNS